MKKNSLHKEKALPPTTLRTLLSRHYDLTSVHFHSATPFPRVVVELSKGNARPLCEILTQMGPLLLAHARVQQELVRFWFLAPTDEQARKIFLDIGQALARVREVGREKKRTDAERRHAASVTKSVATWLKRYQKERTRVGERQALLNIQSAFIESERIKDTERKALVWKTFLQKKNSEKVKRNSQ